MLRQIVLNRFSLYVGKGIGKRAWSKERHELWVRYVENHLGGNWQVRILVDNLTSEAAEEAEAEFSAQYGDTLVNWINADRSTDFQLLEEYHKLRSANRALIQDAKVMEKKNLESAAEMYAKAIERTRSYAFMSLENGLVGRLLEEEAADVGRNGELEALDRLTLCLVKLGRNEEAADAADAYFALYRRDLHLKRAERVRKRIQKASSRRATKAPWPSERRAL